MIPKSPHGSLLQIHPSTFVDSTGTGFGPMTVEVLVLGYQRIQSPLWGIDTSASPEAAS